MHKKQPFFAQNILMSNETLKTKMDFSVVSNEFSKTLVSHFPNGKLLSSLSWDWSMRKFCCFILARVSGISWWYTWNLYKNVFGYSNLCIKNVFMWFSLRFNGKMRHYTTTLLLWISINILKIGINTLKFYF